jgi:hypothetical protein
VAIKISNKLEAHLVFLAILGSFKKVNFVLHIPTGSCVKTLSCSDGLHKQINVFQYGLSRDLHLVQKLIPIDKKIGRYLL